MNENGEPSASLAPLVLIVRAGPKHGKFGDPFTFSATIVRSHDGSAFIQAATGNLTLPILWAIARALLSYGFEEAVWVRLKNGREKHLRFKLKDVLEGK